MQFLMAHSTNVHVKFFPCLDLKWMAQCISLKLLCAFFLLVLCVSSQLLSDTEKDIKIRNLFTNLELILFIVKFLYSRYAYSNIVLEFLFVSL